MMVATAPINILSLVVLKRVSFMRMLRSLMLAVTLILLPLTAMAQADGVPLLEYPYVDTYMDYRVYDLPARVVFTQRFGGWRRADQQGLHRLIVTDAAEPLAAQHHLLYLQWVCVCPEGVVSTVPVSELNRSGPFIYTRPEVSQRGQTHYVTLTARNTRTGDQSEVRVFVTEIGAYRVEYLPPANAN